MAEMSVTIWLRQANFTDLLTELIGEDQEIGDVVLDEFVAAIHHGAGPLSASAKLQTSLWRLIR